MDYAKFIQDAKARRQELLDEVEKLDVMIDLASMLAGQTARDTKPVLQKRSSAGTPTREAVTAILRERGKPCETRELLPMIRARGVEVGGKDPIATLSARLSNAPEFQVHRGIGWWFANEPLPSRRPLFEEAAEPSPKETSAASNASQGGSEDASALGHDS